MILHLAFDMLAAGTAMLVTWRVVARHGLHRAQGSPQRVLLALIVGAALGGFGLGTYNLWLSGDLRLGRSFAGALLGAIVGVEWAKRRAGIRGSTGAMFVPALIATVAIGRVGCFLSGLEDPTYGVATDLPWGHDFGDGVPRHPVQLYESAAMIFLAIVMWRWIQKSRRDFVSRGFYVFVLWYGLQRFAWEFLKPYARILGPFNLFHGVTACLVCYACWMLVGSRNAHEPRSTDGTVHLPGTDDLAL
ncbi:MAG: prolipoprotein diacylglyceryl transferase [Planctomycetes bacterium]|nr:prolipoprotein diacylglyceryl transferase [Planctomycetota bacterium]MCB9891798.1 prolipoprotein diacylglyceryl transferase [Planctomycetota bacterium]